MEKWEVDVPVVLFFFNREYTTRRVFEQIKIAKPRQLFLISDGARSIEEKAKVEDLRRIVEEVDWDCSLYTDFAQDNMGCDARIISGLNYVYTQVDRAIILEDDCFPTIQFFDFCKEMLERYEAHKEVAYISGGTYIKARRREASYFFSKVGSTWGWATWKDRWLSCMITPEEAERKAEECLIGIFSEKRRQIWVESAKRHFEQGDYPWDYLWQIGTNGCFRIVPAKNLVSNIGFTKDSTHTLVKPCGYYGQCGTLKRPYIGPQKIEEDKSYLHEYEKKTKNRVWNKIVAKTILFLYSRKD